MPKHLTQEQRSVLEDMFLVLKGLREGCRMEVGELEAKIKNTLDKMANAQLRLDALAAALDMPEGASRE